MLTLKSHQYKQQMTFSDSEINSNVVSLLSNDFLLSFFHSFSNKEHRAGENMIIKKLKKNKIKEESKKKSKEPKNVKKNHSCFSLIQPHTIFNMKKQCNVFLPHKLLTCCQFQHLKYSIYISIYQYNYLSIYLSIYLSR